MTSSTHKPVALITGASRGLGLEIARAYARRNLRLVLTARGSASLAEAATELRAVTEVVALDGDVSDSAHLERLVSTGIDAFGPIDVLINNASELGPSPLVPLERLSRERFEDILRVNIVAPLQLIQLVLPTMRQRRSGLIVNVSSDAAVNAYPTWGGYGASKAALEHLSRILAAELEGTGVRVNVVDPGDMNTAMHAAAEPGVDLSQLPTPDLIAPLFVQLLDEPASFGRFEASQLLAATT